MLDKNECFVIKDDQNILHGNRNEQDGLWDIPIGGHTAHYNTEPFIPNV